VLCNVPSSSIDMQLFDASRDHFDYIYGRHSHHDRISDSTILTCRIVFTARRFASVVLCYGLKALLPHRKACAVYFNNHNEAERLLEVTVTGSHVRSTRRSASTDRTARRQFQAVFPVITGSFPTNVIAHLRGLSMDLTVGRTVGPTVDSTVGLTVGLTVKLCKHWFDSRSNY